MWVLAATSAIYFNKELFHSQLSGEKCCNFIFKSWLWNLWGKKERDQFQFPSNFHPIKYHDIWKIRCSIASMGIHSIPSSFLGQRDTFSRFNFTFELSPGLKKGHLQDIVIDEFWWFSSMCQCVILTDISSLSGLIDLLGRCSRCCCGEGLVLLNCLTGQKTLHLLPSVDWMKSPCKEAILWVRKKTCFHIGQNWVGKSAVMIRSILSEGPFDVAILW